MDNVGFGPAAEDLVFPAAIPADAARIEREARLARALNSARWFWALFALTVLGAALLFWADMTPQTLHPPASRLEALVQMGLVVLLCLVWFVGFSAARSTVSTAADAADSRWERRAMRWLAMPPWRLQLVMGLPALMFALAMSSHYNPAVFAMALAAIFVAAEHFSSIREAKDDLDETQSDLAETRNRLESALARNQKSIDILLDADGLANWRRHVYQAYQRADDRIDAVIRIFDIDELWWQLGGRWNDYQDKELDLDEGPTLYRALTSKESKAHASPRTDKVLFVGDMALPSSAGVGRERAARFANLLGLTWWLIVVNAAVRQRKKTSGAATPADDRFVVVRIASSASWMHAIDDKIYQVIERPEPHPPSARLLSGAVADEPRRQRLAQWAHDDVRRTGRRGCDGEEYVCAVLREAALRPGPVQLEENNQWNDDRIGEVLRLLGLREWIAHEAAALRPRDEKLCVEIFRTFIQQRTGQTDATVSDLLVELI